MSLIVKAKTKNKCRVCTLTIDYPYNVHNGCIDTLLKPWSKKK